LRIGNIAPDFTLGSNRASRVSLSKLQGKLIILNFWASWCPPCRYEVPALQSVHHEYGPQGVVVLAVNEKEKLENVERFAHDNGINFAVWLDEDGWAGHIYQVRSIPTTYFIDRAGLIRAVQIGSMTREQIVAHLEKLL
jgi:thiol-disulfide isomerase/thioredoxin